MNVATLRERPATSTGNHSQLALVGIITLGAALRVTPLILNWCHPNIFMQFDSWGYHNIAVNLVTGNDYSQSTAPPYVSDVYRPPGYPGLI